MHPANVQHQGPASVFKLYHPVPVSSPRPSKLFGVGVSKSGSMRAATPFSLYPGLFALAPKRLGPPDLDVKGRRAFRKQRGSNVVFLPCQIDEHSKACKLRQAGKTGFGRWGSPRNLVFSSHQALRPKCQPLLFHRSLRKLTPVIISMVSI